MQIGIHCDRTRPLRFAGTKLEPDGGPRNICFVTGGLLSVVNWTGTTSGGTADRIFITSLPSAAFLQNVTFSGFAAGAQWNGLTREIVPVPEPRATVLAVGAALFLLAAKLRKKFSSV